MVKVDGKKGKSLNISIEAWKEINHIKTDKEMKNHDVVIKLLLESYKRKV